MTSQQTAHPLWSIVHKRHTSHFPYIVSLNYPSPRPHNLHRNIQLQFVSLCRLQQFAMPSRLTVVLVSLMLATPVVIFRLWLVILPASVGKLFPKECWCDPGRYHVDCSSSSLKNISFILPTNVRELVLYDNNTTSLEKDSFISRGLTELRTFVTGYCQLETIQLGAFN